MGEIFKIDNVSLKFGKKEIIKEMSFNIKEKQIVGLLGQNDAGKLLP